MTTIGPGLFWCLFIYFLLRGTAAVVLDLAYDSIQKAEEVKGTKPQAPRQAVNLIITLGFATWLGICRWVIA